MRHGGPIALAVATLVGALAGCGGEEPEPVPAPPAAEPTAAACGDNVRPSGLLCGRLEVPLERADPSLGTTEVAYAIRRRSDRKRPSRGAILAIEGGPGYGSIPSARAYIKLFGPLLRRRELLVVDMRGTGHSRAIDCRDLQRGLGLDELGVGQCARQLAATAGSYRTAAAADDLEAVRAALDLGRIDVYGDSYGTYLAESYAFRHRDSVKALVVDSAYPVRGESGWYPSLWRTGIRALATTCEREPGCRGDAARRLNRFIWQLRERGRSVGPLLDAIASAGYGPPDSYLAVNRAIERYLAGQPGAYDRLIALGKVSSGPPRFYSRGLELAVSCNDYPMLWDKAATDRERRRQLDAQVRGYPKRAFEPFTPREIALAPEWGYLECLGWPQPTDLYESPADPDAPSPAVPTLVIAGEFDDITSPAEARLVAADFPDSRVMVVRNAGHVPSLYGSDYPAAARVRAFLRRHG